MRTQSKSKIQNPKSPHHGGGSEEDLRGQDQKLTAVVAEEISLLQPGHTAKFNDTLLFYNK